MGQLSRGSGWRQRQPGRPPHTHSASKGREGDCPTHRTAPNSSQGSGEAVPLRAVLGLPRPPSPGIHTGGIRQEQGARRITQPAPLNLTLWDRHPRPQVAELGCSGDGHGSRLQTSLSQPQLSSQLTSSVWSLTTTVEGTVTIPISQERKAGSGHGVTSAMQQS